MRRVYLRVPAGSSDTVRNAASALDVTQFIVQPARSEDGSDVELCIVHIRNDRVGALLEHLGQVPELHVAFHPGGELALAPPPERIAQHVRDVTPRSPLEILLSAVQSVGSWRGFLAYAAASGVVVWLGLYTETIYLLVAAMLISPFAGPAMNTAIATARGDATLLWRSAVRYLSALLVAAAAAAAMSLAVRQELATDLMARITSVAEVAFVLPLAAGAAGALHLSHSERNSLVSAAAVGMLVAASLAPPAGLVGIGIVVGDSGMVGNAAFLLVLQLVGINLSGAIVFRLYGLKPDGPRYERGKGWVSAASLGGTAAGLVALVALQFALPAPSLQRGSIEQQSRRETITLLREDPRVEPVRVVTEFTRPVVAGEHSLIVLVHARTTEEYVEGEGRALAEAVAARIAERLRGRYQVTALVDVVLMHRAGRESGSE